MRALRGYETWTDAEQLSRTTFDIEATPTIFKVFNDRQTLLITDTELYPGWRHTPGSEHIRSWLGVPLIAGGRVFGLGLQDRSGRVVLPRSTSGWQKLS
jgi:GAF domain-containing protein